MKVRDLLERIRLREIALPEFQREYVWELEQAQKLLESLYKGYPTGSLLFWETTTPPATKNGHEARQVSGQQQIILDGQQRLTALYLLTRGEAPPYYDLLEITHDPRGLEFDLVEGAFCLTPAGDRSPACLPVSKCFHDTPDYFAIAQALTGNQQGGAVSQLMAQCVDNLSRLRGILDYDYPIQVVPVSATLDDAIDVFDRINSTGTKLTPAELALTHISGKWPEARPTMKALLDQLAGNHFHLDLDFLIRCLAGVVSGRADNFRELHYLPAAPLQQGWERLATALTTMISSILKPAYILSDAYLSSAELLIPLTVHLTRHGGAFLNEQTQRRAIYWLYAANMWGRYVDERDQRLAHDLSIVSRSDDPWSELVTTIIAQRGRIDLHPDDLEGCGPQHPLFRMVLITMASRGAIDWATKIPLAAVGQVRARPLFPPLDQAVTPDELLQRKRADEIANQVLLINEPAAPLLQVLSTLAQSQPQLLEQHCIPNDASLWQSQQFSAFLRTRREHIAAAVNMQLQPLKDALSNTKPADTIHELIEAGESASLEFKASLCYNVNKRIKDTNLEQEVAKAVAAFLNAEGGYLLIGVADNGEILGIERDIEGCKNKNVDGFELELRNALRAKMGTESTLYVRTYFPSVDGKRICVVWVFRSPRPVFCSYKTFKENSPPGPEVPTFFVRIGNQSPKLPTSEVNSYIAMHWRA